MGRNKKPRIDGERLKEAMKLRGWSPIDFSMKLYGLGEDKKQTASTNIYRLCLPEDDNKKIGLDRGMLSDACKILNVREEWLLGVDDAMTDFELIEDHRYRVNRAKEISNTFLRPILEKAGYTFLKFGFYTPDHGEPEPIFIFEDKKHESFSISASDLQKMESVCTDLCASMFRNYAGGFSPAGTYSKKV